MANERLIVVRVEDTRSKPNAKGGHVFDRIMTLLEKAVIPVSLAVIAFLANSISAKVERIQKAKEFSLEQSESVEKLTQGLLPNDDVRVRTVLLGNRGVSGVAVLRAIVLLPDGAITDSVRDAAADTITQLINGTDPEISRALIHNEIQVLKSHKLYEHRTHRAATTILEQSCVGHDCSALCEIKYQSRQMKNSADIDTNEQKALESRVQNLRRAYCDDPS